MAYAFLNLSIGHPLLRAAQKIECGGSWGPEASRQVLQCDRPKSYPFAFGNETLDFKPPERLIIAARHSEVRLSQ